MEDMTYIGPYKKIRRLGKGGFALVYLAKHPTLDIDVAVKVMKPDASYDEDDPEIKIAHKRFRNEALVTARLKNPHIVNIFDFGIDEKTGLPYIVMDYLDGGTLKDKLKEKCSYTVKEVLNIIKPIAQALESIHKEGIIHRDLKPSNIMFTENNPVIMDFGIAKDFQTTVQTETGQLIGSLPYMSPERINDKEYDHRSDIYTLGVIIFEMLSGENPFDTGTIEGTTTRIASKPVPPLAAVSSDIPKDFARIVYRMLAKDPKNRLDSLQPLIDYDLTATTTIKTRKKPVIKQKVKHVPIMQRGKYLFSIFAIAVIFILCAVGIFNLTKGKKVIKIKPPVVSSLKGSGKPNELLHTLRHDKGIKTVAFSPDGNYIASASLDNTIKVWNVKDNCRLHHSFRQRKETYAFSVAFSMDSNILASGNNDGNIRLWSISDKKEHPPLKKLHSGPVLCIAFSPPHHGIQQFASGGFDNKIILWTGNSGKYLRTLEGHEKPITSIAYSKNSKYLASGSYDGSVILWDASTGQLINTFEDEDRDFLAALESKEVVTPVAFSPDDKILAIGCIDNSIRLCSVEDGSLIRKLEGHSGEIRSLAFSKDGKKLASGSVDNLIKLWTIKTGEVILPVMEHTGRVNSLAFSPNGRMLASASDDDTIRIWSMR